MEAQLCILGYLAITLSITIIFDIEPIRAILWGAYPILLPILFIKSRRARKKRTNEPQQEHNHVGSMKTFDMFIEESK